MKKISKMFSKVIVFKGKSKDWCLKILFLPQISIYMHNLKKINWRYVNDKNRVKKLKNTPHTTAEYITKT